MMMAGVAYYILTRALIRCQQGNSALAEAIGDDRKGIISVLIYVMAVPLSFVNQWVGVRSLRRGWPDLVRVRTGGSSER